MRENELQLPLHLEFETGISNIQLSSMDTDFVVEKSWLRILSRKVLLEKHVFETIPATGALIVGQVVVMVKVLSSEILNNKVKFVCVFCACLCFFLVFGITFICH